jgi:hypothetical protein
LTRVARKQQACLVCFEADFRYCHRTSVAKAAHHAGEPRCAGTTHLVMSPLEFVQRLTVLIDSVAAAPANDRFGAVNLGCRIPGLGRYAKLCIATLCSRSQRVSSRQSHLARRATS